MSTVAADYGRRLYAGLRDHGEQLALSNDGVWADRALAFIEGLEPGTVFSADDLREALGRSSAVGGVFHTASRRGLIEVAGVGVSRSPSRRQGLQRTWRRV